MAPPSSDLAEKYEKLRDRFISRLMNVKEKIGTLVEQSGPGLDPQNEAAFKEFIMALETNPRVQTAQRFTA